MKAVTFGECLFRLVTHQGERLSQADELNFYLGGTELNIAANLSSLGVPATWVSSVCDGATGDMIRGRIQQLNVDFSQVDTIKGGRPGWYLMETGNSPRPDKVFNRSASSLADKKDFSYDWNKILTGASLFHTSGVTAGLSTELTAEVKKAMMTAREMKIPVSYDFNYRKNIWSIEEFVKRQKDLLPLIDILFCADSDINLFFGKRSDEADYSSVFTSTSLKTLVLTRRSNDESEYGIDVVSNNKSWSSRRHKVNSIDRIGVGDSMAAGFIKSYLSGNPESDHADWAALAGVLKYGIKGDMALLKSSEMEALLTGGTRGIDR